MGKKKKVNLIINIVFVAYLILSLTITYNNVRKEAEEKLDIIDFETSYKNEYNALTEEERIKNNMKPIEEMSLAELEKVKAECIKKIEIYKIGITLIKWMASNLIFIILYIITKKTSKKVIKEKLSENDFLKEKQYFRDIIKGYTMLEMSLIDDFNANSINTIVAELMQLEKNGVIEIKNEEIKIINENNIKKSQKYILENIKDGKLNIKNLALLRHNTEEDALKDGLIVNKLKLKEKIIKAGIYLIISICILNVLTNFGFYVVSAFTNTTLALSILMLGIVISFLSPAFIIFSTIIYIKEYAKNPYFRTKKGEELNIKIEGLKNYIEDYSLLKEKSKHDLFIWEDYLIYSVLFNKNDKIVQEYKKYILY